MKILAFARGAIADRPDVVRLIVDGGLIGEGGSRVFVNHVEAKVHVVNTTTLDFILPPAATRVGPITVTIRTPGQADASHLFEVTPA
jgi:hypothetical protein